jgi:WD40 repeat protein
MMIRLVFVLCGVAAVASSLMGALADAQTYPMSTLLAQQDSLDEHDASMPTWAEGTVTLGTITAENGGHSSPVRAVAFSDDGQFLISGSSDRTVKIWNLAFRRLERNLSGNLGQVTALDVSPDVSLIAIGNLDGQVQLWNWRSGKLVRSLSAAAHELAHGEKVATVAFSPNGETLATASGDGTIRQWDVNTGELLTELVGQQWIESMAFSPDGETIASGGLGRMIELWDMATETQLRSLGPYSRSIYTLAFSPTGDMLAFSPNSVSIPPLANPLAEALAEPEANQNTIHLVDLDGNLIVEPLSNHTDYVSALTFSPNGQLLASGSWDNTVCLWNVPEGTLIRCFAQNSERILAIAFHPNSRRFAVGSGDGSLKIFTGEQPQ